MEWAMIKVSKDTTNIKMPVKSNWTWKPTYMLARFIVGLHHNVKRRLGIWLRPERCVFVSFLYLIDSSKPEAFSQNRPERVCEWVISLMNTKLTLPGREVSALKESMF